MHNANPKGNIMRKTASKRNRTIVLELATSQRCSNAKYLNHQKIKRHLNPHHNPRGGQGSHVPLEEQVEKSLVKNPQKHPLCARIMDNQIPKSLENPLRGEGSQREGRSL